MTTNTSISLAIRLLLLTAAAIAIAASCANRGSGPQGGPRDITPPQVVRSTPPNGSLNFSGKEIDIYFDEIVVLDKAFEKVIVSPPQKKAAVYKALGKRVKVALNDTLKENTTYTIDFADAIVDNNERNKLDGYSFSFATGSHIDTLKISGIVIDASNLQPIPGIMVGIHRNHEDSAFTSLPFDRITRTNSKGEFSVSNISEGAYRLYALSDIGGNYRFDVPNEQIAFLDTTFAPTCHSETIADTIFTRDPNDTTLLVADTVVLRTVTTYKPDSVILRAFTEPDTRQFLVKAERPERFKIMLTFGTGVDSLPEISQIDTIPLPAYRTDLSPTRDTIVYWLTDTADYSRDTIAWEACYQKTLDDGLVWQTDTMRLVYRTRRNSKNQKSAPSQQSLALTLATNASTKFEIYSPLLISFTMPAKINPSARHHLELQSDSIWLPVDCGAIEPADSMGLKFKMEYKWKEGATYRITLDSAMFTGLNGATNDSTTISFTLKTLEDYSTLIFNIANATGKELVQIVDERDAVVRESKDRGAKHILKHMTPGVYYARIIMDENGNGKWDPGSFKESRQPEEVYYFPYSIELRAFWDVEEDWDIRSIPLLEQKPTEIKPKTKK